MLVLGDNCVGKYLIEKFKESKSLIKDEIIHYWAPEILNRQAYDLFSSDYW